MDYLPTYIWLTKILPKYVLEKEIYLSMDILQFHLLKRKKHPLLLGKNKQIFAQKVKLYF